MRGRGGSFVESGAMIPSRIERRARFAPTRFRAPPPQPSRQPDWHAPRVRAAFRADRLEAFRRSVRRALRGEGAARVADAADGRAASDQTRARAFGRAGLRAVAGERLLPVFQRRNLFSDRAAARPDLDVGVARPHRAREAGGAHRRDAGCGQASGRSRAVADAAGDHRHDGADQSRRPSDRQPSALAGDRMAEPDGQEAGVAVRQSYLRVADTPGARSDG
jgi:hypothetical protein